MGISGCSRHRLTIRMKLTRGEIRNEMAAPQNVCWVNKTESVIFIHGNKAYNIQLPGILLSMTFEDFKPTNPEELKAARLVVLQPWTVVNGVSMKDAENPGIAEWVRRGAGCIRKKHDIPMVCARINGVLCSTNVVRGVVDPHQMMPVDTIIFEQNLTMQGYDLGINVRGLCIRRCNRRSRAGLRACGGYMHLPDSWKDVPPQLQCEILQPT